MFINYSKINTSLKEPWNTIISQMTHENPKWGRLSLWPPQLDTGKFLQLTLFLDASAINSRILRAFACSLIEYQKQQRHKKQSIFRPAKLGFEQPFPKARHFFSNLTDLVFCLFVCCLWFFLFHFVVVVFKFYTLCFTMEAWEMGPQSLTHSLLMWFHHSW